MTFNCPFCGAPITGSHPGATFTCHYCRAKVVTPGGSGHVIDDEWNARLARFTFPGYALGALPDGRYRATLSAAGVTDPAGNALAADHVSTFFFLNGDANRDARVNLDDFNILAANFGQSPRDFTQGDFTYDGIVNLNDFNILAGRFGQVVAPAAARTGAEQSADEIDELLKDILG